jgi:WD40 repeat protein
VGDDGTIRMWDMMRAKAEAALFQGAGKPITAAVWLRDGEGKLIIVSGDNDGKVTAYNSDKNRSITWMSKIGSDHPSHSAIMDIKPGPKRTTAAASMYKRCVVFSAVDGCVLRTLEADNWVNIVAIDAHFVVGGGDAKGLFVWNGNESEYRLGADIMGLGNTLGLDLYEKDQILANGGNECIVRLWKLGDADGTMVAHSAPLEGWVVSVSFCEREVLAASIAGKSGSISMLKWDSTSDSIQVVACVSKGTSMSWCSAMSDGLIATACAQKLVHIWRWKNDELALVHLFPARARFGSPDGIGGTGDVLGGDICIGDEAGTLYHLTI